MTSNATDRTLKLVASAYGVAIRPERLDDLLAAWDDWFDHLIEESDQAFAEVSTVFDDALMQADHLQNRLLRAWRDQSPVPTVLVDVRGKLVALNAAAHHLFDEEGLDAERVLAQRRPTSEPMGSGKHRTFRLAGGAAHRSYLAVEAPANDAMRAEYARAASALYLSLMDWHAAFEKDVVAQLDLSGAELKIARGLFEGRTAQEISGDLGRSLPTIRSHIKALLQKTGARRQTELVQFLTILRQVSDVAAVRPLDSQDVGVDQVELTGAGGRLQVLRYGAGRPVLYFTTSSCPEESAEFRTALTAAGFHVIAPVRPGFRGSDPATEDASEALLEDWLDMLLALTGPRPLLAGHREGGILATRAAARILTAGGDIAGLALLSTGAPVRDLAQFDTAPASVRRSFLGAHLAAPALRLGYKTAARLFQSSRIGQDQIIRFFHKESPADARKMTQPALYEVSREILSYCFQNPDQIVRDVAQWASDWSAPLEAVVGKAPVLFVHGSDHAFQSLEAINDFATGKDSVSVCVINEAAQLAIYERPDVVAGALSELAG